MIARSYIIKEFIKRLCIIVTLTFVISMAIGGIDTLTSCSGVCSLGRELTIVAFESIIFIDSALFFIVISSIIWLTVTLSKTNQNVIITLYSHKKTTVVNAMLGGVAIVIALYVAIYASFISPYIKNYISSSDGASYHIEKAWLSTIKVVGDSPSGSVYLMKDIGKYLDGYSLESLSIYKIKNGYLASYEKFNKPFLTSSVDDELMFIYRDSSGKISRNIESDVSIDDIEAEFKRESKQDHIGFIDAISNVSNGGGRNVIENSKITIIKTVEGIILIFTAVILSMCEFPMYHQRFDSSARRRISRVMLFSIVCYSSLEILKIIGGGTVNSHLASLACCVAFLLVFLSRLIKGQH